MMATISARASRDGRFWLVYVPEIGKYTQGRNLSEAREMARDLAATVLEIPANDVELAQFDIELPETVTAELRRSEELRAESQRANHEAALALRGAARGLRDLGLTVRDIGAAIGISHQRAAQLLDDPRAAEVGAGR